MERKGSVLGTRFEVLEVVRVYYWVRLGKRMRVGVVWWVGLEEFFVGHR